MHGKYVLIHVRLNQRTREIISTLILVYYIPLNVIIYLLKSEISIRNINIEKISTFSIAITLKNQWLQLFIRKCNNFLKENYNIFMHFISNADNNTSSFLVCLYRPKIIFISK